MGRSSHRRVSGRKTADNRGTRNPRSENVPQSILRLNALLHQRLPNAETLVEHYEQARAVAGSDEILRGHLGEEGWERLLALLPTWYTYSEEPDSELDAAA